METCLNCIKSITGSKTPSGITVSITGSFHGNVPPYFLLGNYKLKIKSINRISPILYTLTYTLDFETKIIGSAHFKVIPKSVYESLQKYNQLSKLVADISPVSSPTNVFLKVTDDTDDVYAQKTGFSPSEIFSKFGITVYYPSCLEYKITEFVVREGMSVASLVQAIFPIPGTISFLDDTVVEFSLRDEPITINPQNVLEQSYTINKYDYDIIVTGMQSEPKNIVYEGELVDTIEQSDENGNEAKITVVKNIFGRVYGISEEEYTIKHMSVPTLNYLEQLLEQEKSQK